MSNNTAALAHSITWKGSKQSYLTARLLVDRHLVDDCLRGYAYFRWADDKVDLTFTTRAGRTGFIDRQKKLVESLYQGERPAGMSREEEMLADLIAHDKGSNNGLRSFISNFMAVIEFDANRNGRTVTRRELSDYTANLAAAVMDGLQYFIGNCVPYPKTHERTLAVTGAHLVHMLRDTLADIPAGIVNIPVEELQKGNIRLEEPDSQAFRSWVQEQSERAAACLEQGKRYISTLEVLRCKLAGMWYCARFEWYLEAFRSDGYRLRGAYPERQSLAAWVEMAGLGITITFKHFADRLWRGWRRSLPQAAMGPEGNKPSAHFHQGQG
jgi:phytoene/squalene synthetase